MFKGGRTRCAPTVRIARRLMVVGEDIILPIRGLSNISLPCVKGGDEVRVGGIVSKNNPPPTSWEPPLHKGAFGEFAFETDTQWAPLRGW